MSRALALPMSRSWRPRATAALLLALGALMTAGCYNPFRPPELGAGISTPPPVPDSPGNLLRLLVWAYDYRSIAEYRELFTDDYRFFFSTVDPYGNAYQGGLWTREDELASATNLFQGGSPTQPAATSITLVLDRNFNVTDDTRPGKLDRMHKQIHTTVLLTIVDPTPKQTNVTGFATFYVTRGDVAAIPEELKLKGFVPDSTRWYIERWDDDTAGPGTGGGGGGSAAVAPVRPAAASPAGNVVQTSWGAVKVIYR